MAARVRKIRHDEETRKKIQASQLINRLTHHVLSEQDIMSASQVRAAEVLLRKTLPDLASVQHSGDEDNPIELKISWGKPDSSS